MFDFAAVFVAMAIQSGAHALTRRAAAPMRVTPVRIQLVSFSVLSRQLPDEGEHAAGSVKAGMRVIRVRCL